MKTLILDKPLNPEDAAEFPDELLRAYDTVVDLGSHERPLANIRRPDGFADASLSEQLDRIDDWATDVANRLCVDGRPISFPLREAYRWWLVGWFRKELLGSWFAAARFIEVAGRNGSEIHIASRRMLFPQLLLQRVEALGASGRILGDMNGGLTSSGNRMPVGKVRSLLRRWTRRKWTHLFPRRHGADSCACVAADIEPPPRGNQQGAADQAAGILERYNATGRNPTIFFYLVCDTCVKVLRRAAAITAGRGFEPLYIDMASEKNGVDWEALSHPCLRMRDAQPGGAALLIRKPTLAMQSAEPSDASALFAGCEDLLVRTLRQYAANDIGRLVKAHHTLWNHLKPAAVVVADEGLPPACLGVAAAEAGIPSVCVAHSRTPPVSRTYAFDVIALFGQGVVDELNRREQPPSGCTLVSIGACRYDELFLGAYTSAPAIREQLRISPGQPIVTFGSQWLVPNDTGHWKRRGVEWLLEGLPDDVVLVIKKHPLETDDICETVASEHDPGRYRIVREVDLYGLLAASRALVTHNSNIATEAVLLRRPVILIDFPGAERELCAKHGLALMVNSPESLNGAWHRAFQDGVHSIPDYETKRSRLISRSLYADDGKSSLRLAELIEGRARGAIVAGNTAKRAESARDDVRWI